MARKASMNFNSKGDKPEIPLKMRNKCSRKTFYTTNYKLNQRTWLT